MHLVSDRDQTLAMDNHQFEFQQGETIHTENSYKYTVAEFQKIAMKAGYRPITAWYDQDRLFSLHYLEVN
jgi:uncharacterized SAM-dependent methyltransferase